MANKKWYTPLKHGAIPAGVTMTFEGTVTNAAKSATYPVVVTKTGPSAAANPLKDEDGNQALTLDDYGWKITATAAAGYNTPTFKTRWYNDTTSPASSGDVKSHSGSATVVYSTSMDGVEVYDIAVTGKTYTVLLSQEGGEGGASSVTATFGAAMPAISVPSRAGYSFGGYFSGADGAGVQYYAADGSSARAWDSTSNGAVLRAKWTAQTATVTFDAAGGAVSPSSKSVTYGGQYGDLPAPTRAGHDFAGWRTAADGGLEVTASSEVATAGDHTLYARWTARTYTVTLHPAGGTVNSGALASYTHGTAAALPADVTRTGHDFAGWQESESGGVWTSIPADAVGDKSFTAQWTVQTFTVTFADHDGTVLKSETVSYGADATPPDAPTRDGHTFTGWDGAYTAVTADATVTAVYDEIVPPASYTVTFVDWDGAVLKTQTVESGADAAPPAAPTRDGHAFKAWSGTYTAVTANQTVIASYDGEAAYLLRGKRFQRLYAAAEKTPAFAAATDAARIATVMCDVPWTAAESDGDAILPAHSAASDDADAANVSGRALFDAALFCAEHADGMHRAYAQAACYRFAMPAAAVGQTLQSLTVSVSGDPYLKNGARLALFTNSTGVIPTDCATVRTGAAHAAGVAKRTTSADGARWYGATESVTLAVPGGLTVERYVFLLVALEDYGYSRAGYLESAACIMPYVRAVFGGTVAGWKENAQNDCRAAPDADGGSYVVATRADGSSHHYRNSYGVPPGAAEKQYRISLECGKPWDDAEFDFDKADYNAREEVIRNGLANKGFMNKDSCCVLALRQMFADFYLGNGAAENTAIPNTPYADVTSTTVKQSGYLGGSTANGTYVTWFSMKLSPAAVCFALPQSFTPSSVILDWSKRPSIFNTERQRGWFNVWLARGRAVKGLSADLVNNPEFYCPSGVGVAGWELLGAVEAAATNESGSATFATGPLEGRVATLLIAPYVPMDDVTFDDIESWYDNDATSTKRTWQTGLWRPGITLA